MSQKLLVLIRHAHRNMDEPTKDNGLSTKGQEQVKKLVKFARNRLGGEKLKIYSSPKKRCIETILPVAKELGVKVEIDERLTEHGIGENQGLYLARIDEFLDHWKYEEGEITIACSHGDWIPIAIQKLTGAQIELRKSGWAEIEYMNGTSSLTWLIQRHY